jgi:hypothetical protein
VPLLHVGCIQILPCEYCICKPVIDLAQLKMQGSINIVVACNALAPRPLPWRLQTPCRPSPSQPPLPSPPSHAPRSDVAAVRMDTSLPGARVGLERPVQSALPGVWFARGLGRYGRTAGQSCIQCNTKASCHRECIERGFADIKAWPAARPTSRLRTAVSATCVRSGRVLKHQSNLKKAS